MAVGATLRAAREQRGLTIEQIAHATKISAGHLRSIEDQNLDRLPQRVFLRGFVSAYAREVGLDPDETVREYFAQFQPVVSSAVEHPPVETPPHPPAEMHTPEDDLEEEEDDPRKAAYWRAPAKSLAAAALVGAIAVGFYVAVLSRTPGSGDERQNPRVAASPQPVAAAPAETGTAGSGEPQATAVESDVLQIDIRPKASCWLSATVDGELVLYRLLRKGENERFSAREGVVLRVGDPGALAFSINGVEGRALGKPEEPVTVSITRQNYRDFLRP